MVDIQYIPRNMHTGFALLCFVVVIHWLIFPYPSGLLNWHCGNLTIAPVPAKQPWWIWINTSCEFIMNDYITTTKQSTTKPCAYFFGYTVRHITCENYYQNRNSLKDQYKKTQVYTLDLRTQYNCEIISMAYEKRDSTTFIAIALDFSLFCNKSSIYTIIAIKQTFSTCYVAQICCIHETGHYTI